MHEIHSTSDLTTSLERLVIRTYPWSRIVARSPYRRSPPRQGLNHPAVVSARDGADRELPGVIGLAAPREFVSRVIADLHIDHEGREILAGGPIRLPCRPLLRLLDDDRHGIMV
jgi:hypothetical protein